MFDDETHEALEGAFVLLPLGVAHGFRSGASGGEMLVLFVPGGYDRYWAQLADAESTGTATESFRAELARRYGAIQIESPFR
jgi:hypothetical protein